MNSSVIITLNNNYAAKLSEAIEMFEEETGADIIVKKNRLSPNQSEFIFESPDEKFMFTLGTQYGKLLEKASKETV